MIPTRFFCQKARYVLQTSCNLRLLQSYPLLADPSETQLTSYDYRPCIHVWRVLVATGTIEKLTSSRDLNCALRAMFRSCRTSAPSFNVLADIAAQSP